MKTTQQNFTTAGISSDQRLSTKRTVTQHLSAMDQILAANAHRHRRLDETRIKRMNITGKIESADENILEINQEQKTSDDLFEGDVALDPMEQDDLQLMKLREENKDGKVESLITKRQATRQLKRLWHSRRVPYVISSELYGVQNLILQTIQKFNQKSCVQFVPHRGNERDYIIFKKNDGCFSRIGRAFTTPGYQDISIGDFCDQESIIIHEMLHAVGFYHEQSRPDRSKYLEILWENIKPQYESQFLQYGHGDIDKFGISYNYKSIMHYGRKAFGNNRVTMQAIGDEEMELGNTEMSPEDILELNTLYDCKTKTYNSWTRWSSYGPCDDSCYKKRQRYCYGRTPRACGGSPNDYGIENQLHKCSAQECPVRIDGHWGRWSPWGFCSVNCNEGAQSRKRTCDDPQPSNGGVDCSDNAKDYRICRRQRCRLGTHDSDFRSGQLGRVWRNDAYDTPGFDWAIRKGSTPTEGTGPMRAHSGENGYYLFVESSNRAGKDNARLISVIMSATGNNTKCLKFFYHMFGRTTGSLAVLMYRQSKQPTSLFWKSGSQGNEWKLAQITLTSSAQYQLVFEAVIAAPTYSDIAIDDVFIDEGGCDCQDAFRSCTTWTEKGDCANSYVFMAKHCMRACNYCGCRDKADQCPNWGLKQCKNNPQYMEVKCPLTCRVCACHDDDIRCAGWAERDECKRNGKFMRKFCRKSCVICTS